MKVLVTDGLLRKSLAVVRSLGKAGISVTVGEKTKANPSAYSKYCRHSVRYPDPETSPQDFVHWVDKQLDAKLWDLFIPMDDLTMDIVIENRERWEPKCRLVLPPSESYQIARDKYQSLQVALQAGMDCPETFIPESFEEIRKKASHLHYPVLIKPRKNSGSRGIQVAHSPEDLIRMFEEQYNLEMPMIQEFIPQGVRMDVCLIVNKQNQVRSTFVQKEIRHFPIPMGPSTVQESIQHDQLVEQCKRFLSFLPWYGVIELEFMIDPRDGKPKFMEVNPRFWNSLECAIISGIDFPYMLYQLATEENCLQKESYTVGEICRNLLPGDILHFLSNPDRWSLSPSFLPSKRQKIHDDILSLKDPLPTLGFCMACLRYLLDIKVWRKMIKREDWR